WPEGVITMRTLDEGTRRRGSWRTLSTMLACAALAATAPGQTVTVSAGGGADYTTVQEAIDALAPGGALDDSNLLNNVVQIIDDAVYHEPINIDGMGLTLVGTGVNRPTIITDATGAATNTGNAALRIDTDQSVTLENLILL